MRGGDWRLTLAGAALTTLIVASARAQLSVSAPSDSSIQHNMQNGDQTFSEATWTLVNQEGLDGATVQWSCGPFVHTSDATVKADALLELRMLASEPGSGWSVISAQDGTNVSGGDQTATVEAGSQDLGDAEAGLTVTFVNGNFSTLAAGTYAVTVTATISAN